MLTLLDWRRRVGALYAAVRAERDPRAAHELWRRGRDVLLATHPDSPLEEPERMRFGALPVDRYDPDLRFVVPVDPEGAGKTWEVTAGDDGVVRFVQAGRVRLDGLGDLDLWSLGGYAGGLFLPVRDASPDTYGGGRYVLDTVKGADLGGGTPGVDGLPGPLVVDLNFAYNPSCAYSPRWVCPLPQAGNTLEVALPGGERMPPEPEPDEPADDGVDSVPA